jgi:hypothetical protein
MATRLQRLVSALGHQVKLLQRWFVLRKQGVPVKKYGWLLVIDGMHVHHPVPYQLRKTIIPRRKRTITLPMKTSAGISHGPLLYLRAPLL